MLQTTLNNHGRLQESFYGKELLGPIFKIVGMGTNRNKTAKTFNILIYFDFFKVIYLS